MSWEIRQGDALERLREMPDGIVQTCVTSPPYWGLRDYGTAEWEGGDEGCEHDAAKIKRGRFEYAVSDKQKSNTGSDDARYADACPCGARRIDSQLGLEPTPDEYVQNLVEVFREVRRVLRDDGTVWLNLGDSYFGTGRGPSDLADDRGFHTAVTRDGFPLKGVYRHDVLKSKDLCGIPWRVARALQEPWYAGRIKDELDRVWLAAMIDAEGCIFIHRRKVGQSNGQGYVRKQDSFGAGLEVSSTDRVIVERCMAIAGLGSVCEQGPDQNARRKQTLYRWNLRSNVCREILREVYPYLTAKKHEARLACGCPSSGERATAAWQTLKAIHQGGEHGSVDFDAPASCFEGGWYLRSDIIWSKKPNPMPESVTDRPTRSHEYIFLLSKNARYFYDADAVREDAVWLGQDRSDRGPVETMMPDAPNHNGLRLEATTGSRNKRSVWNVATQPYSEAHFATFPPKLIEPCILAGSSPKACGECGAPWERVVERTKGDEEAAQRPKHLQSAKSTLSLSGNGSREWAERGSDAKTVGWQPTCTHQDDSGRSIVLDPFAGSGTTGMVALRHNRSFIGIELNPEYVEMARNRIIEDAPLLNHGLEVLDAA